MTESKYFGRPEFWLDYCDSERDAEQVARLFPEYYQEYYSEFEQALDYDFREFCRREALLFAKERHGSAIRGLASPNQQNPMLQISVDFEPQKAFEYQQLVIGKAREYLRLSPQRISKVRPRTSDGYTLISGKRLVSQDFAVGSVHRGAHPPSTGLRWGSIMLPHKQGRLSNFCVVGMPRSGKTTLLRLLLQSTGWHFNECRLVVYDEKTGGPSAIFEDANELKRKGKLLNPFDRRGVAWDIASDAHTVHEANEIARTLIPERNRENNFFVAAPRAILAGVMISLNESRGENWNLMDLVIAVTSKHLERILQLSTHGREVWNTYIGGQSPSQDDLRKTIASILTPLVPVAAAWDRCEERLSIRQWVVDGQGALILGNMNAYAAAIQAVNRTLLGILIETLLDVEREQEKETFLFLDEFQSLGYVDGLTTLLRTGPGLGVTTVLGVHDVGLLKETYGQHAEGVLAMCGHFALLRTNSRETARWASDLLGQQTVRIRRESVTTQKESGQSENMQVSTTVTEHDIERPLVHADEFFRLPLANRKAGLTGYFKSTLHPTYRGHLKGDVLFATTSKRPVENEPDEYQLFQSSSEEFDLQRRSNDELIPRDNLAELASEVPEGSASEPLKRQRDKTAFDILDVQRISLNRYSDAQSSG